MGTLAGIRLRRWIYVCCRSCWAHYKLVGHHGDSICRINRLWLCLGRYGNYIVLHNFSADGHDQHSHVADVFILGIVLSAHRLPWVLTRDSHSLAALAGDLARTRFHFRHGELGNFVACTLFHRNDLFWRNTYRKETYKALSALINYRSCDDPSDFQVDRPTLVFSPWAFLYRLCQWKNL